MSTHHLVGKSANTNKHHGLLRLYLQVEASFLESTHAEHILSTASVGKISEGFEEENATDPVRW